MAISNPINPLAVHLGQGVVQVYVLPPETGVFDHYEIRTSRTLDGIYYSVGLMETSPKDLFLFNFAVGQAAYLQIRAVSPHPDNETSEWIQVKRGDKQKAQVTMQLTCIIGSQILEGTLFVRPKKPGRTMGFVSTGNIVF